MAKNLRQIIEIYISKAKSKGHSPATILNKENQFKRMLTWLDGREFDLDAAEDYITYLRTKRNEVSGEIGLKDHSIRTTVANIKALVRFMHKRGYITENWAVDLSKPKIRHAKFEPPSREVAIQAIIAGTEPGAFKMGVRGDNKLNAYIKGEMRLALLFQLDTGLRPSELLRLKGSDLMLHLPTPKFRIPPSKGHEDELGIVPPQLLPELKKRLNRERLFEATNEGCNAALRRGFEKIGVKLSFPISMHKLRHFFASYLIKAGVHIDVVKQLLRHNDISTTIDHYIHYYDSELINAVYTTIPEARATMPIDEKLKYYEAVFNKLGIDKDASLKFDIDRTSDELQIRIYSR